MIAGVVKGHPFWAVSNKILNFELNLFYFTREGSRMGYEKECVNRKRWKREAR